MDAPEHSQGLVLVSIDCRNFDSFENDMQMNNIRQFTNAVKRGGKVEQMQK